MFDLGFVWRREWDSNPRYACDVHTISNRAPSASSDISPSVFLFGCRRFYLPSTLVYYTILRRRLQLFFCPIATILFAALVRSITVTHCTRKSPQRGGLFQKGFGYNILLNRSRETGFASVNVDTLLLRLFGFSLRYDYRQYAAFEFSADRVLVNFADIIRP